MELNNGYIIADRYVCRKSLGKGGNGHVYLAYDNHLEKNWAVKLCKNLSELEIYALKKIDHYAFPRIVDVVHQDDYEFLIMDYIEGETLANYCRYHSATEKQVLLWCKKIAAALLYLHNMNPSIRYVDCKPSNIMITPSGDIRLIDLGSIYVEDDSLPNEVSATLFYMPDELSTSLPSISSDVYSLGMTMYRLVTGSNVEYRDSEGVLQPEKVNRHISRGFCYIIKRCTKLEPKYRYQSVKNLLEDLEELISKGKLSSPSAIGRELFKHILEAALAIAILACAIFFKSYCVYIIPVLFVIFLELCRAKRIYTYEIQKDIYRSSVPLGLIMLILSLVFGGIEKGVQTSERLDVSLYDTNRRKLLVRPDSTWLVDEDIYLSLSQEELHSDPCTITISCSSPIKTKSYSFKCATLKSNRTN